MIDIQQLKKSYGEQEVVSIPEMRFVPAQVYGVVGLNGAGKTTFFNLMARFIRPSSGQIRFNDLPLKRQDVAFLETENFFYPNITGNEYLKLFPATNNLFDLVKTSELLGIPLNKLIDAYSTGMRKKLALLAIIRQDKPIYILDEPFNGLDMEANKFLETVVQQLKAHHKTVFISSHILAPSLHVSDEIHLLQRGVITNSYLKNRFGDIETELFRSYDKKLKDLFS